MQPHKLAIIGSGGVGGVLASAAHAAGHDVILCARTPISALTVETPEGVQNLPAIVHTIPDSAPDVDWVLLTTKVQDVANAAPWLRRFDGPNTPVVIVQNGIEHEDSARPLTNAPLLPALINVATERVHPGYVVMRSSAAMTVPACELGSQLDKVFQKSTLTVRDTTDFHTERWRKMLTNVTANPITALTGRRLDVFTQPDIRRLAEGLLHEAVAVARAEGAKLSADDAETTVAAYGQRYPAESGTSMLYDRLAGVPTEHEYITGALVRAGRRHGIPTPLNDTMLALMRALPAN